MQMKEAILIRMYRRIHIEFKSRRCYFMVLQARTDFLVKKCRVVLGKRRGFQDAGKCVFVS